MSTYFNTQPPSLPIATLPQHQEYDEQVQMFSQYRQAVDEIITRFVTLESLIPNAFEAIPPNVCSSFKDDFKHIQAINFTELAERDRAARFQEIAVLFVAAVALQVDVTTHCSQWMSGHISTISQPDAQPLSYPNEAKVREDIVTRTRNLSQDCLEAPRQTHLNLDNLENVFHIHLPHSTRLFDEAIRIVSLCKANELTVSFTHLLNGVILLRVRRQAAKFIQELSNVKHRFQESQSQILNNPQAYLKKITDLKEDVVQATSRFMEKIAQNALGSKYSLDKYLSWLSPPLKHDEYDSLWTALSNGILEMRRGDAVNLSEWLALLSKAKQIAKIAFPTLIQQVRGKFVEQKSAEIRDRLNVLRQVTKLDDQADRIWRQWESDRQCEGANVVNFSEDILREIEYVSNLSSTSYANTDSAT